MPPPSPDGLAQAVLFLLVFLAVLMLIGRAIALWYWKINRIVRLLENIDESLRQLPAVRRYDFQHRNAA